MDIMKDKTTFWDYLIKRKPRTRRFIAIWLTIIFSILSLQEKMTPEFLSAYIMILTFFFKEPDKNE